MSSLTEDPKRPDPHEVMKMPRVQVFEHGVNLWVSANETEDWAAGRANFGSGSRWQCSTLAGHRLFAQFDSNGVIDHALDGKDVPDTVDGHEFNCLCADALKARLPKDHPARFVAVDQFL